MVKPMGPIPAGYAADGDDMPSFPAGDRSGDRGAAESIRDDNRKDAAPGQMTLDAGGDGNHEVGEPEQSLGPLEIELGD